jgi:hypothetical protein
VEFVARIAGAAEKIGGPVESMAEGDVMDVRFGTSVAVITPDRHADWPAERPVP